MKLATWNVNSIRAREERLLRWVEKHRPDVLCLQELKVEDEAFPLMDVQALGYHAALHGQRTYNGVAILSKEQRQHVGRVVAAFAAREALRGAEVDDADLIHRLGLLAYLPGPGRFTAVRQSLSFPYPEDFRR